MAIEHPDIIGEYISASQRYEVDGVQYDGLFEPPTVRAWETTNFILFLQNMMDSPQQISIKLNMPQSGRFRGNPLLVTKETEIDLELSSAEVGRLIIPMTTAEKVVPGRHQVEVELKVQHDRSARRVRQPKQSSQLNTPLIDDLVGLDLVSILGANYTTKKARKASFDLTLSKEPGESGETPPLAWQYHQIWTLELADTQRKAIHEVNVGRIPIIEDLNVEPLFVALYGESQERFADSGIPLRIGEAIAIGKLLTFTVHFFLGQSHLQEGLLYPIWERALANDMQTANTLNVIKYAGYRHIVKLAAVLSFGMIAEVAGKHLWTKEERREVATFIADALEDGGTLPADFLYLPLMMGAARVATKVHLPDEDMEHSLQLIQKARQARRDLFVDEEMTNARQLFDQILQTAMSRTNA